MRISQYVLLVCGLWAGAACLAAASAGFVLSFTGFAKQHAAQQALIVSKAFEAPAGKKVRAAIKETAGKMAANRSDFGVDRPYPVAGG